MLHSLADYQTVLRSLFTPLLGSMNEYISTLILPNEIATNYTPQEAHLESFSRMLLGVSLDVDIEDTIKQKIFQKICIGVDPSSSTYFGEIKSNSQMIVELFPILLFCCQNKKDFFKLNKRNKQNIENWFLQINHVEVCNNNWCFFPILVNLFLNELGCKNNQEVINTNWEKIDEMYLGNGWYSDGDTQQRDYYIAFAFHFYSLLYALYTNDTERKLKILERASLFAKSYIHYFAASGEAIAFGRSLTYKFAQIAFWSIYTCFIKDEQQLSIMKGIINRNLRWWFTQNIFDKRGVLINGYTYANPYILEQYNASGSPYWAFKAFFCLLRPNTTFFKVKEQALPQLQNTTIPEAYTSICHKNGQAYAFINGQRNNWFCQKTAKYEKFVYSSLFGFSVSRSFETLDMIASDNTLAARIGDIFIVRNNTKTIYNNNKVQISDWQPLPSILIRTFIFLGAPWHTRVHYIITDLPITLFDCGYAIDTNKNFNKKQDLHFVKLNNTNQFSAVTSDKHSVGIVYTAPNTNILHPHVAIPYTLQTYNKGINLMISTFFGDSTDTIKNDQPLKNDITILNGKLIAFGSAYPLPKLSILKQIKYSTYKIIHNIKTKN